MMDSVSSVFEKKGVCFLADSDAILKYLVDRGYECIRYSRELKLPENCISIQTSKEHFLTLKENLSISPHARILTLPLVAFDNAYECFIYSFEQLKRCNFNKVFESCNLLMNRLSEVGSSITVKLGNDVHIDCNFNNNINYSYPAQLLINNGSIRSIAQYFEVNFNHLYPEFEPDFKLNGRFNFISCLYAIHPSNETISRKQFTLVKKLFDQVVSAANCTLVIENNIASSLMVDDVEYIEDLKCIAGDLRKSEVTELAFGLNSDIINTINWSYNSQINEGCTGMHLGFGDGKSGIHMDFICPMNDNSLKIEKLK